LETEPASRARSFQWRIWPALEMDGVIRAVEIAEHVDGRVKVVWTREGDIQHDMYRPYVFDRLSAGLDEKGVPVA
jgi:isoquinoline 1-oxidoreductase subunit beta